MNMNYRNNRATHTQAGFTLIELVVVMIIIGILAAVALPNLLGMAGTADDAVVQGVGAEIASWTKTNFAAAAVSPANAYGYTSCQTAVDQAQVASVNIIPLNWTAPTAADVAYTDTPGVAGQCTLTMTDPGGVISNPMPFTVIDADGLL